jgi:hypothetical protein
MTTILVDVDEITSPEFARAFLARTIDKTKEAITGFLELYPDGLYNIAKENEMVGSFIGLAAQSVINVQMMTFVTELDYQTAFDVHVTLSEVIPYVIEQIMDDTEFMTSITT